VKEDSWRFSDLPAGIVSANNLVDDAAAFFALHPLQCVRLSVTFTFESLKL